MGNFDELKKNIEEKITSLIKLKIVTAVGPATSDNVNEEFIQSKNSKVIFTTINLLEGDITTTIDPMFIDSQHQSLLEFHRNREKQGQEIIANNIKALQELYKWASTLISHPTSTQTQT